MDFHSDEICMRAEPQGFLDFQVSLMNSADRYLSASPGTLGFFVITDLVYVKSVTRLSLGLKGKAKLYGHRYS